MSQHIPVFIACPTDANEQRTAAKKAIYELNNAFKRKYNVSISSINWEEFAPISNSSSSISFPERIRQEIKEGIFL